MPRHWCFKRKYLQGKRGIEKPPFDLPDFIKVGVPPTSVADPDLNWIRIQQLCGSIRIHTVRKKGWTLSQSLSKILISYYIIFRYKTWLDLFLIRMEDCLNLFRRLVHLGVGVFFILAFSWIVPGSNMSKKISGKRSFSAPKNKIRKSERFKMIRIHNFSI